MRSTNDAGDQGYVRWFDDKVLLLPEAVVQLKELPGALSSKMVVVLSRVAAGGGRLDPIQGISEAKASVGNVTGRAFLKRIDGLFVIGGFMSKKSRGSGHAGDQTARALAARALIEEYAKRVRLGVQDGPDV